LEEDREKRQRLKELNFKFLKFNMLRRWPFNLEDFPAYGNRIVEKLTG
jgi:hypothetical protein